MIALVKNRDFQETINFEVCVTNSVRIFKIAKTDSFLGLFPTLWPIFQYKTKELPI